MPLHIRKTDVKFIKNVGHLFFQVINRGVFGWFACKKLMILFPPAKYDFNNPVSFNGTILCQRQQQAQ